MVAVGLVATITVQAASSDTGYLHDGNKIKASSTPYRSAHDERIRKANDRALAVLSPSPSPQTSIFSASWTSSEAALAYSLFFYQNRVLREGRGDGGGIVFVVCLISPLTNATH
jgi:hypothetical protein